MRVVDLVTDAMKGDRVKDKQSPLADQSLGRPLQPAHVLKDPDFAQQCLFVKMKLRWFPKGTEFFRVPPSAGATDPFRFPAGVGAHGVRDQAADVLKMAGKLASKMVYCPVLKPTPTRRGTPTSRGTNCGRADRSRPTHVYDPSLLINSLFRTWV